MFPYPDFITLSAESIVVCCSCRMDGLCRCQAWQTLAKPQLDVHPDGCTFEDLCFFGLHLRASCWGLERTGWLVGVPIWFQGMLWPYCIHGFCESRNRDSLWYQCLKLHCHITYGSSQKLTHYSSHIQNVKFTLGSKPFG